MPNSTEPPVLDLKASLKKPIQWAFAAGLLTAIITLFLPNYYKSEARLLPVESKGLGGSLGGLATAAAAFGVSVPGGDSNDANFVDVLNSRWLREQLSRPSSSTTHGPGASGPSTSNRAPSTPMWTKRTWTGPSRRWARSCRPLGT